MESYDRRVAIVAELIPALPAFFVVRVRRHRSCLEQFGMPVVVGTGDKGNRIEITMPNGLTQDLSGDRSVMHTDITVTDESVNLQVSQLSRLRRRRRDCCGVRALGFGQGE